VGIDVGAAFDVTGQSVSQSARGGVETSVNLSALQVASAASPDAVSKPPRPAQFAWDSANLE
jgi:hypothetical protein